MTPEEDTWIKAWRSEFLPDNELAGEPVCRRWAWLDLRSQAAHSPHERPVGLEVIPLNRGELLASVRFLANRWRWSKSRVSRFLELLKRRGKVETVRETPDGTVYRVVKYEITEGPRDTKRDSDEDTNEDATGTAAGQRKEGKEGKEELSSESDVSEVFEYWRAKREEILGLSGGPRMTASKKRLSKIRARLREGYSVGNLKEAIDGCLGNEFNVRGGYLDVELICRDQGKVEFYRAKRRERAAAEESASEPDWLSDLESDFGIKA